MRCARKQWFPWGFSPTRAIKGGAASKGQDLTFILARMGAVNLLSALLIVFPFRRVGAIHVEFNRAGVIEANVGERLSFNCTAPPYHISELLEIGQTETIEELASRTPQPGDPTSDYDPEDCQFSNEGTHCSKITNVTVTGDMVGKAYQCRSFKRGEDHTYYYSQGGYIHVRAIIPSPTTMEATGETKVGNNSDFPITIAVVAPPRASAVSKLAVTCPTPPVPQHELGELTNSTLQCECSVGTTLSPHLQLSIQLLALPPLFRYFTNNP